ncbi:hypothetical protein [Corynebacterium hindlerae]|uniref:hypothetical protein n=1 Tax=Corynebacterium hindlerae TaxID=699041 RepID=UPI003AAF0879
MSTSKLDQPDNYTGNHTLVKVRELSLDQLTHTLHLVMWYPGAPDHMPTYCGRKNTRRLVDAKRLLNHHTIPTIGHIARQPGWGAYNGHELTLCPDCLSMAMCQAEMLGQRYRVKTTIDAMRKLPGR